MMWYRLLKFSETGLELQPSTASGNTKPGEKREEDGDRANGTDATVRHQCGEDMGFFTISRIGCLQAQRRPSVVGYWPIAKLKRWGGKLLLYFAALFLLQKTS